MSHHIVACGVRPEDAREPLFTSGFHQPGMGTGGIPSEVDDSRFDGGDHPPLREGSPNLVLSHSARPPVAALEVAEAKHVIPATRTNHCSQTVDVTLSLAVIENVEEPAVEHRVKLFAQINEAKSVAYQEARHATPL